MVPWFHKCGALEISTGQSESFKLRVLVIQICLKQLFYCLLHVLTNSAIVKARAKALATGVTLWTTRAKAVPGNQVLPVDVLIE